MQRNFFSFLFPSIRFFMPRQKSLKLSIIYKSEKIKTVLNKVTLHRSNFNLNIFCNCHEFETHNRGNIRLIRKKKNPKYFFRKIVEFAAKKGRIMLLKFWQTMEKNHRPRSPEVYTKCPMNKTKFPDRCVKIVQLFTSSIRILPFPEDWIVIDRNSTKGTSGSLFIAE